jgi:hypothetical protein
VSSLKINRLDSPLTRTPSSNEQPARSSKSAEQEDPAKQARRTPVRSSQVTLESVPAPKADEISSTTGERVLRALPQPPALGEPLELLSTRLPSSIRRRLSDLTAALRVRDGGRVSQKSLPEQEVLAVLIWLAGSADNPEDIEQLSRALDAYRARRYAAEARALGG